MIVYNYYNIFGGPNTTLEQVHQQEAACLCCTSKIKCINLVFLYSYNCDKIGHIHMTFILLS